MEIIEIITGLVASAFLAGGVLAIAGLGETVTQRVGVFNLGIEGFMAMAAFAPLPQLPPLATSFLAVSPPQALVFS